MKMLLVAVRESESGRNAKCRPALKLYAYLGRPEMIGAQSEWRD
jgi:hypothetical protein